MSDVFISHVEEDSDVALELALRLEEAGYRTWSYEIDSIPGPSYLIQTGRAIEQSAAVVLIISDRSLSSNQLTREVVRAHESGKHFIPVLRNVTHTEFQNRQPEWREAIAAATSIRIPQEGIAGMLARVVEGLRALDIQPRAKPDSKRIDLIHKAISSLKSGAISGKGAQTVPAVKPVEGPKSRINTTTVIIALVSVGLVALIVLGVVLPKGFLGMLTLGLAILVALIIWRKQIGARLKTLRPLVAGLGGKKRQIRLLLIVMATAVVIASIAVGIIFAVGGFSTNNSVSLSPTPTPTSTPTTTPKTTPTPAVTRSPDELVTFADLNLEIAIRKAIGLPVGDIHNSDLKGLTNLEANYESIAKLNGLEYCTSLVYISLAGNKIADIAPLSSLTNLTNLNLEENQINSVSPLGNLTGLRILWLDGNQVRDISSLSNLHNLTRLGLSGNTVSDISSLSDLTSLSILYLPTTLVSDIHPLSGLIELTQLYLQNNQISDISPLSKLTSLTYLRIDGNQIHDISALSNLSNLSTIIMDRNMVSDVSPLSGLTLLAHLELQSNQISDIAPLLENDGLSSGDVVDLRDNPLSTASVTLYIQQLEQRGVTVSIN